MKYIYIFILFLFSLNYFFALNENNIVKKGSINKRKISFIKRKILLLPFLNVNNIKKYDYLSATLTETLKAKLLNSESFVLTDTSQLDNKIKQLDYTNESIIEKEYAIKIANQYKSDVVVLGKYIIVNEEIMILISAIDIFTEETVASSSINGDLGVDIFRLIDEVSDNITEKMIKKLPMVKKTYFDEMTKIIRKQHFLDEMNNLTKLNRAGIGFTIAGGILLASGTTILLYDLLGYSKVVEYNLENLPSTKKGYEEYNNSYNALISLLAVGITSMAIGTIGLSIGISFILYKKNRNKLSFNVEINQDIKFEICYFW